MGVASHPSTASVVVDNYNYGRFLKAAVESALGQTYPCTEVVVVDDGSTDQSRDVLAGFGADIVVVLKDNGGQASAFNSGFEKSRGDGVVFLDADDTLEPTAVERVLPLFGSEDVAKAHWPLWRIDADGRRTGGQIPEHRLAEGWFRDLIARDGPETHACPPHAPPTSGNAWSRRLLERVMPMPEDVFRWGADNYLLNMAPIHGAVAAVDEPLGCYRVHGRNDTLKPLQQRATEFFARYERCREAAARELGRLGVPAAPEAWPRDTWFHRIAAALQDIDSRLPAAAPFILVDDDQWGAESVIGGRRRIPFTEREGAYWGPPADDGAAVQELERLRRGGARFLAVAWVCFWYLEHYPRFAEHLRSSYPLLAATDRLLIFDLT